MLHACEGLGSLGLVPRSSVPRRRVLLCREHFLLWRSLTMLMYREHQVPSVRLVIGLASLLPCLCLSRLSSCWDLVPAYSRCQPCSLGFLKCWGPVPWLLICWIRF